MWELHHRTLSKHVPQERNRFQAHYHQPKMANAKTLLWFQFAPIHKFIHVHGFTLPTQMGYHIRVAG